jgi:signal transduction histidine kinase
VVSGVNRPAIEDGALRFPDVPRLALDELLEQLMARAQEVVNTQGRLRGLLRANQMIGSDLALPVVLRRVVDAARELIGARYAALGVIAPDGHLSEFVHVGMPDEDVARIGHLPQGKGLLGALIDDPAPIRLDRLGDDDRSSGFPPGHPPMDTFLGVPIRVRDEVFGNLYLTGSTRGAFTAEDEELAKALAATAGGAIDNARHYATARSRQQWLQATAAITRQMLNPEQVPSPRRGDYSQPLQLIAEQSADLAAADLVTVVLPRQGSPDLWVEIAVGNSAPAVADIRRVPIAGSLSGRVFTTGEPLRVSTPHELEGTSPAITGELDVGPMMIVPLTGSQGTLGVLTAARHTGRPAFTADEVDMAAGFAAQASVAIELAEARSEQSRAAMLDERDRIAADLHDHVIQRLFATGLGLQSVAGLAGPGRIADRIHQAIVDLDDTISQIRTSIFQLNHNPQTTPSGVRSELLEVVTDAAVALGFEPAVRFAGLLEETLPGDVVRDLVAVLREGLSNVARHAHARSVDVRVTATPQRVCVEVYDDGSGMGDTDRRSGLANLRHCAERRGGGFALTARDPHGTVLQWWVPAP